jgi:pyridoxamine 5'-phosphate oxidase
MDMELAGLRENYIKGGLAERDLLKDPLDQFRRWFAEAQAAQIREPNAMTLATATPDGIPSARVVLLTGFDDRGFVFFTNYQSRKGEELEENPHAALVFYWGELERQVRITGTVTKTSREKSEAYFASRPVPAQIGAWVSEQSSVIPNRKILEDQYTALAQWYEGQEIPAPPHWGGYLVSPETIEFWQGRPSRLHDRILFTRIDESKWEIERLSP